MVIDPTDIFGDIKIYKETTNDYFRLVFPAIDLADTSHGLEEFFEDHVTFCNGKWGNGNEIATFEQLCCTRITYRDNLEDATSDILHLKYHSSKYPDSEADAYFTLGIYELRFDIHKMANEIDSEDFSKSCNDIIIRSMHFIATIIIMSVQIAAVLSKENLDKDFYNKIHAYLSDNVDGFEPNPIMMWLDEFFNGYYTDKIMESEDEEEIESEYVSVLYSVCYIMDRIRKHDGCMLLSYFPLYLANYNNDIISEEEIYSMFETYGTKSDFEGMGWEAPEGVPDEYVPRKPTIFDFVNGIISDQEG